MGRSNSSKKLYKSHRFLHVIGFTEIEIHGFQVLQVSSPDHHQLGRAWVEPRGFVVSEVSWIVRLEESVRAPRWVVFCCGLVLFSIGFGEDPIWPWNLQQKWRSFYQIDSWTSISSRNFHSSHPSFKALQDAVHRAVDLIAQKSAQHQTGCAGPPCCRIGTVGLLRSPSCPGNGFCMYWFHYFASLATCPDERVKANFRVFHRTDCTPFKIQLIQDKSRRKWLTMQTTHPNWWPTDQTPNEFVTSC